LVEILAVSPVKVNTLANLLKVLQLLTRVVLEPILVDSHKILKLGWSAVLEILRHVLILRTQLLGTIAVRVIRPVLEVLTPHLKTTAVTVMVAAKNVMELRSLVINVMVLLRDVLSAQLYPLSHPLKAQQIS